MLSSLSKVVIVSYYCWCWQVGLAVHRADFFPTDPGLVTRLPECDDCASPVFQFPIPFKFFGSVEQSSSYTISNNGIIYFGNNPQTFNFIFCLGSGAPTEPISEMVFPFSADINTGDNNGNVTYYLTTHSRLLARAKAEIVSSFPGAVWVNLAWVLVATWDEAEGFGLSTEFRNTFQAVLTGDESHSFAIFNYDKISWSGTGSGLARAGFDFVFGSTTRRFLLPDSCTTSITSLVNNSNVDNPGKYVFRVDTAQVEQPRDCLSGLSTDLSTWVMPTSIGLHGYQVVTLSGVCLNISNPVQCLFNETLLGSSSGRLQGIIGSSTISCLPPSFSHIGRLDMVIFFTNLRGMEDSALKPVFLKESANEILKLESEVSASQNLLCKIKWNQTWFSTEKVVIQLHSVQSIENSVILVTVNNTGETTLDATILFANPTFVTGTISAQAKHDANFSGLVPKVFADSENLYYKCWPGRGSKNDCTAWAANSAVAIPPISCPPTLKQAQHDPRFIVDMNFKLWYHPEALACFRSVVITNSTSKQECCYSHDGYALCGPGSGGTAKLSHPRISYWHNIENDIIPFYKCCRLQHGTLKKRNELCRLYFEKRPSDCGLNYKPPIGASISGDPHFKTFDNLEYTFNGFGEYYLLQGPECQIQAWFGTTDSIKNATVAKAVSFSCYNHPGLGFHVQLNDDDNLGIRIFTTDGIELEVLEEFALTPQLTIQKTISGSCIISGKDVYLEVGVAAGALWMNVFVEQDLKGKGVIRGLLGNLDGIKSNDFQNKSGETLPIGSNPSEIHYYFGETWRVPKESSLMVYTGLLANDILNQAAFSPLLNSTVNTNTFPEFHVWLACGNNNACYFDFQASGNLSFAKATRNIQETFEETKKVLEEKVVICNPLGNPRNGLVFYTSLIRGSLAIFTCNPGYVNIQSQYVICIENGFWTPGFAHCVKATEAVRMNWFAAFIRTFLG